MAHALSVRWGVFSEMTPLSADIVMTMCLNWNISGMVQGKTPANFLCFTDFDI